MAGILRGTIFNRSTAFPYHVVFSCTNWKVQSLVTIPALGNTCMTIDALILNSFNGKDVEPL